MTAKEIIDALEAPKMKCPAVVITGGEPMLQRKPLAELTKKLHEKGWHTEIETAGTIAPTSIEMAGLFTVSPKLANSGNPLEKRLIPETLEIFATSGRAVFKFVVSTPADFDEIDELVETFGMWPVYIMPEGNSVSKVMIRQRHIAAAALERGYYLTTRLQVLLYGNKRGA